MGECDRDKLSVGAVEISKVRVLGELDKVIAVL